MAEPQTTNEHVEEDASELIFPKGKLCIKYDI